MSAEVLDISSNRKYQYHPTPEDYAKQTEPAPAPAPLPPIPTLEPRHWDDWLEGAIVGGCIATLAVLVAHRL